jgi:hypothetical protein
LPFRILAEDSIVPPANDTEPPVSACRTRLEQMGADLGSPPRPGFVPSGREADVAFEVNEPSDFGRDSGTADNHRQRNSSVCRYPHMSCFGGLPFFSLSFDVVNSGRFRDISFPRDNQSLNVSRGITREHFRRQPAFLSN